MHRCTAPTLFVATLNIAAAEIVDFVCTWLVIAGRTIGNRGSIVFLISQAIGIGDRGFLHISIIFANAIVRLVLDEPPYLAVLVCTLHFRPAAFSLSLHTTPTSCDSSSFKPFRLPLHTTIPVG
jgi:hypothetical protein